ncbi:pyridoxamine 5'-phosphate oxidase [Candidatus Neoehrlichia procyonis]|uniref:Pyridoxine/pyridoxamine 5'-phosphate oxidase n=1 Tax=Candidatus Neoehrlichia procyonis str. RAC413 TaxID=1359163 RepID=A0A0F3NNI0_9RICK|nr:pyridoxamine 5'-phosphate oxidase [Candidatus Neoehrlichia lotoris]KJV69583.1 pyridoxamine 5'-phosphate oxidase [Candidatus Neoehrlichia lotoris str. RAC413]
MKDPIELFSIWYDEILRSSCKDPTSMVLATCGQDLKPSARIVLLKKYDNSGFVFFTNLHSKKGQDIAYNPNVALVFDWSFISKQVRVEGKIELLTSEESDSYYASRMRGSQISAWCSKQSSILKDRDELLESIKYMHQKFINKNIPRPDYWVGMKVVPELIEFWQEGIDRLHIRHQYSKCINDTWKVVELYP